MSSTIRPTEEERQPPLYAIMGALHKNSEGWKDTSYALKCEEGKSRNLVDIHLATLGRLVKYEGQPIIDEAFAFMLRNGAFIKLNSRILGVKTHIGDYKTKQGKIIKAHFTHYKHYLETVKDDNLEPKYYDGNFLVKDFAEILHPLLRVPLELDLHEYKTINDYFCLQRDDETDSEDEDETPIAQLLAKRKRGAK